MSSEPESAELTALVGGLASPDIASRERSARELSRRGIDCESAHGSGRLAIELTEFIDAVKRFSV